MPTVDVNGTTLEVVATGPQDAPAVVLGHALFFDLSMFDAVAAELDGELRVVRYDHRGQGGSGRGGPLDMDTLAEDAAALIDHLGIGPCHYAGNSMGGFVALRLAARRPELVSGVTVINSSAEAEGRLADFAPLVQAMGEHGVAPVLDVVLEIMLGQTTLTSEDPARVALRESCRAAFGALGPDIGPAAEGVIHRTSVLDELPGITVPVVVVAGEEDRTYDVAKSERIAAEVPGARLEVVPDAGHSTAAERPDVIAGLLREAVRSAAGTA